LFYISFDKKGEILISDTVETPKNLGITANMQVSVEKPHQDYLAYHRERFLSKHRSRKPLRVCCMQGVRSKTPKVDVQEFSIMDDFESFNLGLVVDNRACHVCNS
jgi:hypothetical protein